MRLGGHAPSSHGLAAPPGVLLIRVRGRWPGWQGRIGPHRRYRSRFFAERLYREGAARQLAVDWLVKQVGRGVIPDAVIRHWRFAS